MTAVVASGTRRTAILAHLADHPDLTAYDLARAIGAASTVTDLLRNMEAKGEVVARIGRRPGQGRPVHFWRVAPPGTVPSPRVVAWADEFAARRREQDRLTTAARRARRARARVPFAGAAALPGAACRGADPALFFPQPGDTETEAAAAAICAGCPVRAVCYARAVQNGEPYGIWGGVNLETAPRPRRAVVTPELEVAL
jgi:WhiB family redox-sensing transcriptional regulator